MNDTLDPRRTPLVIVVGAGGVGKTTLAAALGLISATAGHDSLVMTFDPSLRLKDALGVGDDAAERETEVPIPADGRLAASLLDARATFDRLIERYAPDDGARERILTNRFYDHLSGNLAGVLEYMASERLFEVSAGGRYDRIVLDTPPTRQALDFLGAPERIVSFLDSGALRIALKPWFDASGHLRATARLGPVGRNVEAFFDRMVGLELLRDMAEFFQAFAPLYDGFRERALEVQRLLRDPDTLFVLVSSPGRQRVADTLFFARRLLESGYRLGPIVMNRIRPAFAGGSGRPPAAEIAARDGRELLRWLGERDRASVGELHSLLGGSRPLVEVPLLPDEPTDLESLARLGALLDERLDLALRGR
jgi:anion-transporting  ArsA/GET3 family ATPase